MDDIFETIFSLIDINKLNSKEEFDLYIQNLINHPTPTREACAYKLEELYDDNFLDEKSCEIILGAITDINPNVSRSVCKVIEKNPKLQTMLKDKIIDKIKKNLSLFSDDEIKSNNKCHAKNKITFSLYWLLEALYYCIDGKKDTFIDDILNLTIKFSDYTIREKTAKILTKINNPSKELVSIAKNDNNFYVKFYSKFL